MKVAVVGTGIAGMLAARLLNELHEVVVFEADSRIGGHVNTVSAEIDGAKKAVDTGFIVFNDRTYPTFLRLMDRLGVESRPAPMSFSVRCERTGLEYNGRDVNSLFAQRKNLFSPSFLAMVVDIVRFNREAKECLAEGIDDETMEAFLSRRSFGSAMREFYLYPMMAAIWSADPSRAAEFPARHFLAFFRNHGLLDLSDRPQWRTIVGGSKVYAERLVAPFRERVRLNSPVESIRRDAGGVVVKARGAEGERFDRVVLAVHSDQALRMLADASDAEREILGAIPYRPNETVLHTDARLMPKRRLAWAAWNSHLTDRDRDKPALTYDMEILQGLGTTTHPLVTLNRSDAIDPARVLGRYDYAHPQFSFAAVAAQRRRSEISGVRGTHYCGAYWGYGFHEDGAASAVAVAAELGSKGL